VLGLLAVALLMAAGYAAEWIATRLVNREARGRTYADVKRIPHRRVGLVLGCSQYVERRWENPFYTNRIAAAASLYRASKVDYLIVSGDNHRAGYDEPSDMKLSLIRAGVPAERIYCDYAGFRTLDSVVRVQQVFGQQSVTIVSQAFHNRRAIFLARSRGIDAIGFNAADVDATSGFSTRVREQISKVGAVLDAYLLHRHPKFLGPKVVVGS
jgi:SanA protein